MRATLRRLWEQGQAAWPDVSLDEEAFASHLASKLPPDAEPAEAERRDAAGLYLACACSLGVARALAAFDRTVLSRVPEFLARIDAGSELPAEVSQVLRARLLVTEEGRPPRIAAYGGEGPLAAWVRTAAVRTALNLLEKRDEQAALGDTAVGRAVAATTPEQEVAAHRHRALFREVLEQAVSALPAPQRAALRMHFAEGLTGDEIGGQLGISRATVVRWLSTARDFLLRETRRQLSERLRLSAEEADSFIASARSRLDLSLSALFVGE
jgi:RNA polymerase sigma-70 factor (ECF subfamily)